MTVQESSPRRPRRSRARRDAERSIAQQGWRAVENRMAPAAILSEDEVEAIHATSLRILSEIGVECLSAPALDRFAAAGAEIDRSARVVRMDPALVEGLIAQAPAQIRLTPRNPARAVEIGGRAVTTTLVAGPPAVHDCVTGRRPSNMADYENLTRLAQHFDAIHMLGNQVAAPIELPANTRHLDCYLANVTLTDRAFHCTGIGRGRAEDGIRMMAIARGMTAEAMVESPGVTTVISVNSPRRFDDAMADGMIAMAEMGQAVCVTPFTLMGAMTPVTLPAALAQQNAEALFGIALTQIVRPGAPAIYGAFTSNVDMKSGAPAFGTPEHTKALIASGQLARRHRLPYRATPCAASNAVDGQAVWEQMMGLWGCVLGGANLWYHAAGWLEGGLCASYEKVVMDAEMLQQIFAFLEPEPVTEETLGFDAIARVPCGGHFFGDPHTMERYQTAFYAPMLSDLRNFEAWSANGAKTATERATELWQRALAEYEEPALDPAIREELEAYVARRKEAIGDGEP